MQIENIMKSTITTQLEGEGGLAAANDSERPIRSDPMRPVQADMSNFVFQQIENLSNDYDETAAGKNDESQLFLTLSNLWVHIICIDGNPERRRERERL